MGVTSNGGVAWYRRVVDVPAAWAGKDLVLSLGAITVRDRTWFNGQVVGDTLMPWESRTYTVPGALVHPGANVIAVRVFADGDNGGFTGDPAQMTLAAEHEAPIAIAEGWRIAPGPDAAALGRVPSLLGMDPWAPAALYNGKIAPLVPYALRGFLWYQGEQNTSAPERYGPMLESMIADWRARFGGGNLPFGIVQLANFGARSPEPWDSGWAELRDEQRKTIARVPATGLAVTVDIGDAVDIHPKNKQDVGRRLAGWALATTYGKGGEWSGPLYRAAAIDGSRIRVEFDHVGRGLVARSATLAGFEIAGHDRRFVRAEARIEGSTVIVSSPSVPAPAAARYAWDDDPEVSLFNADGLPASPFRTDDWPRRDRDVQ
jgi:sialate O-acetylesterase